MEDEVKYPVPVDPAFPFKRVEIYPKQKLGKGAYGFVCKGKCDKLQCAAKLLHSVFLTFNQDSGVQTIIRKFTEECRLLSTINHPCIVQFLGVARIDEQPILLTELMDESLLKFIEKSHSKHVPISLYTEVNIIHDIAVALSYLHSRNILHRDLSSNNVLLLLNAGCKAKISDFGVSKLYDLEAEFGLQSKYLTKCPGTPMFMSPEAIKENPQYSDKLDVFSLGVICIHLLSKKHPDPSPMTRPEIDSRGRDILVPVLEHERRQENIKLIDSSHPLRSLALKMISDNPSNRPTADDVCDSVEKIKTLESYLVSMQRSSCEEELKRELENCYSEIKLLKEKVTEGLANQEDSSSEEVKRLQNENLQLKEEIEKLRKANDDSVSHMPRRSFSTGPFDWTTKSIGTPCHFQLGSAVSLNRKAYFSRPFSNIVHVYDTNCYTWSTLPGCPMEEFTLTTFKGKLLAVGGVLNTCTKSVYRFDDGSSLVKWNKDAIPPMFCARILPAVATSDKFIFVAGGSDQKNSPLNQVEIYDDSKSQWFCAFSLPNSLASPIAIISDDNVFVIGGSTSEGPSSYIYQASLSHLYQWSSRLVTPVSMRVPWQQIHSPVVSPTAVTIGNHLFLLGGVMGDESGYPEYSSHVFKYNSLKRNFSISIMPHARGSCLATVFCSNKVVILGGCGTNSIDIGTYVEY